MGYKRLIRERLRDLPILLLLVAALLVSIGLAMQYSAAGGSFTPYAKAHFVRLGMGGALALLIAFSSMMFLVRSAYLLYGLCVLMLVYVEVSGMIGGGAQRWINLGFMTLQPSEFAKLGLALALARYYHYLPMDSMHRLRFMAVPALLIALPVGLIFLQPNLGTATITTIMALAMLFAAGITWKLFAAGIGLVAAAIPLAWEFVLHSYQKQRVMTFLNPDSDPLGAGYNVSQSVIAVGSGGAWGKGFAQGSQGQLNFLPEKHTDFIFTMLAEEWGFAGALILLLLYAMLLLFSLSLITRSKNRFGALLACGLATVLFMHIFVNIAMVMGVVPVVGVPLPFLSYGGSFLLTSCVAIGLLINVYWHRDSSAIRLSAL